MTNEYDLGTAVLKIASAAGGTPVEDIFRPINADDYDTLMGGENLPPGQYIFKVTKVAFDPKRTTTVLAQFNWVRTIAVVDGAQPPEGGVAFERYNNFSAPALGATEGQQKAHRISIGRFKGLYQASTGTQLTGEITKDRLVNQLFPAIVAGQPVVGGIRWRVPFEQDGKRKSKGITYSEWLLAGKPTVYADVSSIRAVKPGGD